MFLLKEMQNRKSRNMSQEIEGYEVRGVGGKLQVTRSKKEVPEPDNIRFTF